MALVKKIDKLDKNSRLHQEVDCTYNIFTDNGGNKILQIDT